jgi:hypothetical protein
LAQAGAALLILALSACAVSDGGVGGTGIATVRGNVLDPAIVAATAQNPGIGDTGGSGASAAGFVVQVQDTDIQDVTDEAGVFKLEGLFSGDVTLEFRREDMPEPAMVPLFVPSGSEVTLTNIEILDGTAAPEQIRVERLIGGIVADAVCEGTNGSFLFQDDSGLEFTVSVDAETAIQRQTSTEPLQCSDLKQGSRVKIRGLQSDRRITAREIRVLKSGDRPQAAG